MRIQNIRNGSRQWHDKLLPFAKKVKKTIYDSFYCKQITKWTICVQPEGSRIVVTEPYNYDNNSEWYTDRGVFKNRFSLFGLESKGYVYIYKTHLSLICSSDCVLIIYTPQ